MSHPAADPTEPEALSQRHAQGTSASYDWLPPDAPPHAIAETLCAMANTREGGTLVIGVPRPGQTAADPTALMDRALDAILSVTPRLIIPLPAESRLNGAPVVVVHVPAGLPQVYAIAGEGRYLHRVGARNLPLEPSALRRLMIVRGEITYEAEIHPHATRDDLDWHKAQAYARRVGALDVESLLVKRGCAVRAEGALRPTHAGLLLFGTDPQGLIRGAEITAVRFAGTTMGDTFNRQDIGGTLPDQIRTAETFLRDYLRKGVALTGAMARTEHYEYPLEAVRELVVNAVAHRDYSISGDSIRLFIFQDRLEITSPGLLPGPVTLANIRDERFSRNPVIVQVLADMGFIERLGYGIDRVMELMRGQSLREPTFSEAGGGLRVTLYNQPVARPAPAAPAPVAEPPPASTTTPPDERPTEPSRPPLSPEAAAILANYRDIPLNARQEAALAYLGEPGITRITNSELQRMYPDVHPETIRRDLSDMVAKDILSRMGEKRGAYYVLRRDDDAPALPDEGE